MSKSAMTISLIALLRLANGETVDIRLSEKFHFEATKNDVKLDEKDKEKGNAFIKKMNVYLEHLEKNPTLQNWYTSLLQLENHIGNGDGLSTSFINNMEQFKESVVWVTQIITRQSDLTIAPNLKFEKFNLHKQRVALGEDNARREYLQQIMQNNSHGIQILQAPIRIYGVFSLDKNYEDKIFFNNPLKIDIDLPWNGHIAKESFHDYNSMIETLQNILSNKKDSDHIEGFMCIEFFPKILTFPSKFTGSKSLCWQSLYFYKVKDLKSFLKYLQTEMLQLKLAWNFPDMALDQNNDNLFIEKHSSINTPLLFDTTKSREKQRDLGPHPESKEEKMAPQGLMARVCNKLSCFS